MNFSKQEWWGRFQKYYTEFPTLGLAVDLSRMNVDDAFFAKYAVANKWITRFPMWDWVGGRTSVFSLLGCFRQLCKELI